MRFTKLFANHLVQVKDGDRYSSVIKGTEHMLRFPEYPEREGSLRGVATYGTKKIDGVSCVVIANGNKCRLPAGWTVFHEGTCYAYILPPGVKP